MRDRRCHNAKKYRRDGHVKIFSNRRFNRCRDIFNKLVFFPRNIDYGRNSGVVHAFVDGIRLAFGTREHAYDCGRIDGQFIHGIERFGSTMRINDYCEQNEFHKKSGVMLWIWNI